MKRLISKKELPKIIVKYWFFGIIIAIALIAMSACKQEPSTDETKPDDTTMEIPDNLTEYIGTDVTQSYVETDNVTIPPIEPISINIFEGIQFTFSGLSGYGTITINKDMCPETIKNNVEFVIDENENNGYLYNGEDVTIKAVYDNEFLKANNYSVETDTTSVTVTSLYTIKNANDFSEDRAWMQLYDKSGVMPNSWVCIDNKGQPLFKIIDADSKIQSITQYCNGYAHIVYANNRIDVIDLNGNITSSYSTDKSTTIMAYGDGYTFICTNISDFSNNYDEYSIYDANGKITRSFTVISNGEKKADQIRKVYYCGDSVFSMNIRGGEVWFYSASNDNLLVNVNSKYGINASTNVHFNNGVEHIYNTEYKIILLSSTLDISFLDLPTYREDIYYWWPDVINANDGICLLWSTDLRDNLDVLMAYDINKEDYIMMESTWLEKIDGKTLKDDTVFVNGYIALPLLGSDEKPYVALFDKNFNIVVQPIKDSEIIGFSGTRLILKQRDYISDNSYRVKYNIYDISGNIVFNLSDMGYSTISPYSNGFAVVTRGSSTIRYIDENGHTLFDNIIIDNVKTVDINN